MPASMAASKVRPSLWWCLLALPFFIGGLAGFVYFLVDGIGHISDAFTQMAAPGSRDVVLEGGQTYTIFLEAQTVFEGRVYSTTDSIEGLECTVTSDDGTPIAVRPSGVSMSYESPGRSGRSILAFTIPRNGRYALACGYGSSTGPQIVLAVGSDFGKRMGMPVVKALASGFAGGILGVGVMVIVAVAHYRAKKRVSVPAV